MLDPSLTGAQTSWWEFPNQLQVVAERYMVLLQNSPCDCFICSIVTVTPNLHGRVCKHSANSTEAWKRATQMGNGEIKVMS